MKKIVRTLLFIVLIVALLIPCISFLGCGVTASKETAQKAIVETALAYYRKNPYMQYDCRSLTIESGQYGPGRLTQNAAPEYADYDQSHFSQCTEFVLDILNNTFGWTLFDGVKMPHTDPGLQWDSYEGKALIYSNNQITDANRQAEIDKYVALLEPGDIIVSFAQESGHALMYLGDCLGDGNRYIIHCWGSSVTYTGLLQNDVYENGGSIKLQTIENVLLGQHTSGPNWDLHTHTQGYLKLFRFVEDTTLKRVLTDSAQSRVKYSGLSISRCVEGISQYNDVPSGAEITVSVTVKNDGNEDISGLKIQETVPTEGLKPVDGEETSWTVDLKKGASVTKSYRAIVTAKRGDTLTIPAGAVDKIPTRELEFKVGGAQFTEEQKEALLMSAEMIPQVTGEDLAGVKDYYRQVLDIELPLPDTAEELFRAIFEKALSATGDPMIQIKEVDETNRTYREMILREHICGYYVKQGWDGWNRLMEIKELYYQPGDLFLSMQSVNRTSVTTTSGTHYYIYLGEGAVLHYNKGIFELMGFDNSIAQLLQSNSLMVFRPTLAFDDVTTTKVPTRVDENRVATDFATFKELCGTGMVVVEGKVVLEESLSLGGQRLIVNDGAELDLSDFDLTKVGKIQVAENGKITSSGTGRIQAEAVSKTAAAEALKNYAEIPVNLKLGFTTSKLTIGCYEKLIIYNEELSAGGDALRLVAEIIQPGWTLRMDDWYGSNFELALPSGIIIDVHGQWLSLNGFGDGDLTIIDTVGGGFFGWRGATSGQKIIIKNNIDASGATLQVGYKSVTKGDECYANAFFTGQVTYKELNLLYGSKAEAVQGGSLTEAK